MAYTDERDPPDYRFDGRLLPLMQRARTYLEDIYQDRFSGRTWPIEGYVVILNSYHEEGYAAVSFCPKVESAVEGVPFEVADRGIWKNGPGVQLFISLKDFSLLKTVFMR